MNASLIRTDGCGELIMPENEKNFSLEEIQKYVGGYIEIIYLEGDMIMVVNEEGKVMGMDINPIATFIAHENNAIRPHDCIVGDAVICESCMLI